MAVEDIDFLTMILLVQLKDHQLTIEANSLSIHDSIIWAGRDDPALGYCEDRGAKRVGKVGAVVDTVPSSGRGTVQIEPGGLVVVFSLEWTT